MVKMNAELKVRAQFEGIDMEERIKECSMATIECEMRVIAADRPGPVTVSQTCSFVMGVDAQYPSVEAALMNKKAGDRVKVRVPPEEIFGAYDPELVRDLPRADYKQERIKPGRVYREMKRRSLVQFMVKEVRDNVIVADFNDPRAGTWAEFDILVKEVRPAKKEEMTPACAKTPLFPEG
jgi:FKBP-type peptidyl-prolyl cis-trans isomerase SlyD